MFRFVLHITACAASRTQYIFMRIFALAALFTLVVLQSLTTTASAILQQKSGIVVYGSVSDSKGNPVVNAHIVSEGNKLFGLSDAEGKFAFPLTSSFPISFELSALGFVSAKVLIDENSDYPLEIVLQEDKYQLRQVEVIAQQYDNIHSQQIDAIHVRALPSASGHAIEGLVRSQMGVASGNELSSQYRVRGGNFDENLVVVNGQEVYRPFLLHSGQQEGLSFVNPDLVESVEFSAGGFSASYEDKMSSVLDITYKKPESFAGSFSAGVLGANAHLEGSSPGQKLTWISGARYKTNRYLLGTLDEKGYYHPDFTDVQAYLTYQLSPSISFGFLGYYSLNRYQFEPQTRETTFGTISEVKRLKIYFGGREDDSFETGYAAFSTEYKVNPRLIYRLTLTGFRTFEEESYDILGEYWMQEVEDPFGNSDDGAQIAVGSYLQHARNELFGIVNSANLEGSYLGEQSKTSWGMKYRHEEFRNKVNEWELIDSADYSIPYHGDQIILAHAKNSNHDLANHRVSGYFKNNSSWFLPYGRLTIDAGIRAGYFSFNRETTISPRLLISYLPEGKNSRYRLSGGFYYQAPFFKEMRMPDGSINKDIESQRSIHLVAGYDYYFDILSRPFKFTTELYYKDMDKLIPYQIDNVRIVYSGKNEAEGYATGIDFKINGELVPGEESWATLSLMKSEENLLNDKWNDPGREGEPRYIPRPSDQRINFSMFLQDHLPNNPDFKAHLSFYYGSGLPFGPPRSERYKAVNRMPSYRRVDIGFSYDLLRHKSRLAQKSSNYLDNLWLGIEIFNLPNINNTISYYWVTDIYSRQYAVPNYLTSRRINLKITARF